jgi:hypothetical protein
MNNGNRYQPRKSERNRTTNRNRSATKRPASRYRVIANAVKQSLPFRTEIASSLSLLAMTATTVLTFLLGNDGSVSFVISAEAGIQGELNIP